MDLHDFECQAIESIFIFDSYFPLNLILKTQFYGILVLMKSFRISRIIKPPISMKAQDTPKCQQVYMFVFFKVIRPSLSPSLNRQTLFYSTHQLAFSQPDPSPALTG